MHIPTGFRIVQEERKNYYEKNKHPVLSSFSPSHCILNVKFSEVYKNCLPYLKFYRTTLDESEMGFINKNCLPYIINPQFKQSQANLKRRERSFFWTDFLYRKMHLVNICYYLIPLNIVSQIYLRHMHVISLENIIKLKYIFRQQILSLTIPRQTTLSLLLGTADA